MNHEINHSWVSYVATLNDKAVAFCSFLPFPGVGDAKTRRCSRIVVLPDFQGMGIGKKFLTHLSSLYLAEGHVVYLRTISPALGISVCQDKQNWEETAGHMKTPRADTSGRKIIERPAYSVKYVGEASTLDTSVVMFRAEAFKDVSQFQTSIFDMKQDKQVEETEHVETIEVITETDDGIPAGTQLNLF